MSTALSTHRPPHPGRRSLLSLIGIVAILASALAVAPASSAATKVTAGWRDIQYGDPAAPGGDDVTADRSQSKLWFNDGRWFGVLFDTRSSLNPKFRIYRFDMATQNWTSTTVPVDDRNRSHADVLSVGTTVYVASAHGAPTTNQTGDLRFYRYTYNATTKAYVLATGPRLIPGTSTGTGYATIARDTAGKLWIAFTQGLRVKVSSSTDNGLNWSVPIDVPGQVHDLVAEDVAAIATVSDGTRSGVGVLWDNQTPTDDAFHYAIHLDTGVAATWQPVETVLGSPGSFTADNHLSLKTDPGGNAIAALKLGKDSDPAPNGSDPEVTVVKRTGALNTAGTWTSHPVTNVTTKGTRPILVIDGQNNEADVFLTFPTLSSNGAQAIYRRTAPLGSLNFGAASLGTAVIASATELAINDATSMKQATTAASGILVEATNIPTLQYFHACIGVPCPVAPVANFSADTTTGAAPLTVTFTDTSTNGPTSWAWNFGDGTTSTARNPVHTFAGVRQYTVTLTASNLAGSDLVTRTNFITVTPPPQNAFFGVDPVRLLDTRANNGLSGKFVANIARTWQIGGRGTIPAGAIAITGNLTVTGQTKAGYVSIGPSTVGLGTTSSLNFPLGDVRANGITVPLSGGPNGTLSAVYKAVAGAKAHVILDVTGYFLRTTASGATYHAVDPIRLLDTRDGNGLSGKFQSKVVRTWQITGRGPIPASGVVGVTGNLTVVNQTAAGFVFIGPAATSTPTSSTINFPLGDIRANGVTVKLSAAGKLSAVYVGGSGRTHLVFDVTGYFMNDGSGARFVAVNPARILDTRAGIGLAGVFHSGTPRTWTVGNRGGVDPAAIAVIGNVTVVNQTRAGFVSVTPTPVPAPTTSTINFPLGDVRANGMTVKLSVTATLSATLKAGTGTSNLVYDVFGYYK